MTPVEADLKRKINGEIDGAVNLEKFNRGELRLADWHLMLEPFSRWSARPSIPLKIANRIDRPQDRVLDIHFYKSNPSPNKNILLPDNRHITVNFQPTTSRKVLWSYRLELPYLRESVISVYELVDDMGIDDYRVTFKRKANANREDLEAFYIMAQNRIYDKPF